MKPLISVIMPTYNHGEFIGRSIESVLHQTYQNLELIIIDNFSKDNTEEIVKQYKDKRIKYFKFNNNGVIASSRNYGIKHSSGEFIAFLDSDDWWYSNKLSYINNYLDKADIIHHDLDRFDAKGKKVRKLKGRQLERPVFIDLITRGNALWTSSVVVKKELLEKVNLFDEDRNLIALEDFDTWLKISRVTEKFLFINKSLGAYWISGTNITQPTEEYYNRINYLYQKYFPLLSRTERFRAEAFMSYLLGRIKQKLRFKKQAIELFKISIHSNDLKIKLKSFFMLVLLKLY